MTDEDYARLGNVMLANYSKEALENGYGHAADDPAEVGRSALAWGDIEPDGTLN